MSPDFWADRFHWCSLAAGMLAASEGWLHDSERVRRTAYAWYEEGAMAGWTVDSAGVPRYVPPALGKPGAHRNPEKEPGNGTSQEGNRNQ